MTHLIRLCCGSYGVLHIAVALGLIAHIVFVGLIDRFMAVVSIQVLLGSAGIRAASAPAAKSFGDRALGACVLLGGAFDALYLLNGGHTPAIDLPVVGPVSIYVEFDAAYRIVEAYSAGVAILPWVFAALAVPVAWRLLAPSRPEPVTRGGYL